ncbi:MAG: hypothetical protein WEB63_09200 [Cucumibacter sp.]
MAIRIGPIGAVAVVLAAMSPAAAEEAADPNMQGHCMASFIFFMALSKTAIDAGRVDASDLPFYQTLAFAAEQYWHRTRDEVDAASVEHHDTVVAFYESELVRYRSFATGGGEISLVTQADEVGGCARALGYLDD